MVSSGAAFPATVPVAEPMDTLSALRRLAASQDPEAWSAILETHGPGILNVARRITGDDALAEDVCQESLLQIRAHAGQYRPVGGPTEQEATARGWIMRVACFTAFKMLRARERAQRREALTARPTSTQHSSAADVALSREEKELIRHEVNALPETSREALCLHFYGGLTYAELASNLACSTEAVKKRVQRGLEQLRSRLVSRGLIIGLGALTLQLSGGVAEAAEIAGVTGAVGTLAQALDPQRHAAWQALLNGTQQPALSCVANFGGAVAMSKTVLAVASVAVIALSSASSYYIAGTQRSTLENQMAALQENVQTLQKQLETARQDVTGLRTSLADRQDESTNLRNQVAELDKRLLKMREEQIQMEDAVGPEVAAIAGAAPHVAPEIVGIVGDVLKKIEIGKNAKPGDEATPEANVGEIKNLDGNDLKVLMPDLENALKEALKNGNVQVKRFTLPGGGEAQVMIQGAELMEKGPDGKLKVKRFEIPGGGQGQVIIQMEGMEGLKEKKAEPPPKAPEQF